MKATVPVAQLDVAALRAAACALEVLDTIDAAPADVRQVAAQRVWALAETIAAQLRLGPHDGADLDSAPGLTDMVGLSSSVRWASSITARSGAMTAEGAAAPLVFLTVAHTADPSLDATDVEQLVVAIPADETRTMADALTAAAERAVLDCAAGFTEGRGTR